MTEHEFWQRLELRICTKFEGFVDSHLRHYWCDGLVPEDYQLTASEPHIDGLVYCGQSGGERWRFTLQFSQQVTSPDEIDWSALLPSDRLTGWLTPDPESRTLRIAPQAGYDD